MVSGPKISDESIIIEEIISLAVIFLALSLSGCSTSVRPPVDSSDP